MRSLLAFIFTILLVVSTLYGSEPYVLVDSYDDAVILSQETKLQVLLIFTSNNCPSCISLKDNMPEIKDTIVCFVEVNRKNRNLIRKFNINSMPVSIILDKDHKESKRLVGFSDKKSYEEWLHK